MGCLDENTVSALVGGSLGTEAQRQAESHLAHCPQCRSLVSELVRQSATAQSRSLRIPATWVPLLPSSAPPVFGPGDLVAERYHINRFVAEGGMGAVYEAEDLELKRRVALKTVRSEISSDRRAIDRFKREIYFAHKVTHPNVCRIFDLGFDHRGGDKITFLTMEFLAGETLSERLARTGAMSWVDALPIIEQMVAALEAAHAVGVVHRDFKSPNVMLVPEAGGVRVVVTDFGLARASSPDEEAQVASTQSSGMVGSPAYMAPEQVAGQSLTPAVDVYALGVVMFEMVTGRWPFVADTAMLTAIKRLSEDPPSPRADVPDLPLHWEQTILRCLARAPAARFAHVVEVVRALRTPTPLSQPSPAPGTRHAPPGWALWAALPLLLVLVAIGWWRTRAQPKMVPANPVVQTAAPVPPPPPVVAAPSVQLSIRALPADATLSLDGRTITNPFQARMPKDPLSHVVIAKAAGYHPGRTQLSLDRDQNVELTLQSVPSPKRARSRARKNDTGDLIVDYPE